MTAEQLAQLAEMVEQDRATEVARSSLLHGPRHWRDVARIGMLIERERPSSLHYYGEVIFAFAALHDSKRYNEDHDPSHGDRAADLAWNLHEKGKLPIYGQHMRKLTHALRWHTHAERTICPAASVCWDADRLTLMRVGKMPKVEYMNTRWVKDDFSRWLEAAVLVTGGTDQTWAEIAHEYQEAADGYVAHS